MSEKHKYTGRTRSIPAGMGIGVGVSLGVTAAAIAALAKLVDSETLAWENIGYGIMAMLLAASFLGAMTAYRQIKRQRLAICLSTGAVFFLILLSLTALFFGGQYEGMATTFLLTLSGSAVAGLLGLHGGRGERKRHVQYRKS